MWKRIQTYVFSFENAVKNFTYFVSSLSNNLALGNVYSESNIENKVTNFLPSF